MANGLKYSTQSFTQGVLKVIKYNTNITKQAKRTLINIARRRPDKMRLIQAKYDVSSFSNITLNALNNLFNYLFDDRLELLEYIK